MSEDEVEELQKEMNRISRGMKQNMKEFQEMLDWQAEMDRLTREAFNKEQARLLRIEERKKEQARKKEQRKIEKQRATFTQYDTWNNPPVSLSMQSNSTSRRLQVNDRVVLIRKNSSRYGEKGRVVSVMGDKVSVMGDSMKSFSKQYMDSFQLDTTNSIVSRDAPMEPLPPLSSVLEPTRTNLPVRNVTKDSIHILLAERGDIEPGVMSRQTFEKYANISVLKECDVHITADVIRVPEKYLDFTCSNGARTTAMEKNIPLLAVHLSQMGNAVLVQHVIDYQFVFPPVA